MARANSQIAKDNIYRTGLQVPDKKTKSGFRLDRSQPEDDQDEIIVPKGTLYYSWKFRYGSKQISLTAPKQSQLTQSAYLGAIYDMQDEMDDVRSNVSDADSLQSWVEDFKERIEALKDEQQEKLDNMPESLQSSPTGELLQERYDTLDSAYSELDGIDCDYDEPDDQELKEELAASEGIDTDGDDWEDEIDEHSVVELKADKLNEWLDEKCDEISGVSLS